MPAKPSAHKFSFCGQETKKTILPKSPTETTLKPIGKGRDLNVAFACFLALGLLTPGGLKAAIPDPLTEEAAATEFYEAGFGGTGVAVAGGALGILLCFSGAIELRKNGIWKAKRRTSVPVAVVVGPIVEPPTQPALTERAAARIVAPGDGIPEPAESVVRHEISHVIRTIDEVSLRANVLALDAAIEAAGSGESAMGFALVADEVRSLAQGTARAARETANTYEACLLRRDSAVQIYNTVGQRLCQMVQQAREVHAFVDRIAHIAPESKRNFGSHTSEEVENSAGGVRRLKSQAAALQQCVNDLQALV